MPKQVRTLREQAQEVIPEGIEFDCALPQAWVDQLHALGVEPRGRYVWIYDGKAGIWGRPFDTVGEYPGFNNWKD